MARTSRRCSSGTRSPPTRTSPKRPPRPSTKRSARSSRRHSRARKTLTDHVDELHALARGLLEYETLTGEEIRALLRGETIVREHGSSNHEPPTKPREASGRRSSVPTSGVAGQPGFGTGPEPQPGA